MGSRTSYTSNAIEIWGGWRAISNLKILLLVLLIDSNPFCLGSAIIDKSRSSSDICLVQSNLRLYAGMLIGTEHGSRWTRFAFMAIKRILLAGWATNAFCSIKERGGIRAWSRARRSACIVSILSDGLGVSGSPVPVVQIGVVCGGEAREGSLIVGGARRAWLTAESLPVEVLIWTADAAHIIIKRSLGWASHYTLGRSQIVLLGLNVTYFYSFWQNHLAWPCW